MREWLVQDILHHPPPFLPMCFKKKNQTHCKVNSFWNFFRADALWHAHDQNGKWSLEKDIRTKRTEALGKRLKIIRMWARTIQLYVWSINWSNQTCMGHRLCARPANENHKLEVVFCLLPPRTSVRTRYVCDIMERHSHQSLNWVYHLKAVRSCTSNFTSVTLCFLFFKIRKRISWYKD